MRARDHDTGAGMTGKQLRDAAATLVRRPVRIPAVRQPRETVGRVTRVACTLIEAPALAPWGGGAPVSSAAFAVAV